MIGLLGRSGLRKHWKRRRPRRADRALGRGKCRGLSPPKAGEDPPSRLVPHRPVLSIASCPLPVAFALSADQFLGHNASRRAQQFWGMYGPSMLSGLFLMVLFTVKLSM